MRLILIALAALGLSACNLVYSERPLFSEADARGAPKLKPGVWVKPKADCRFDAAAPIDKLEDCADPMLITASELRPPKAESGSSPGPDALPFVLARGAPLVLQLELDLSKGGSEKATKGKPARVWIYQGLEPVKFDDEGRIVEARAWTAQCGPPPPKSQDGSKTRYSTDKPLPGLTMREENCIARAQGPVRNAIRASEAYEADIRPMRWLRDQ